MTEARNSLHKNSWMKDDKERHNLGDLRTNGRKLIK
jgi:hypothetical protein